MVGMQYNNAYGNNTTVTMPRRRLFNDCYVILA